MRQSGSMRGLTWPPLLYLVVFFLTPMAIVVSYSFLRRDFESGGVHAEFSGEAWNDALAPDTLVVLGRSLAIALTVAVACLALGYPCVLALGQLPPRGRQLMLVAVTFPLITSQLLRVYGWMNLLPLDWRGTWGAVTFVLTVNYLPFMLLPLLRAWERLPPNVTQAAFDLGATPWQAFWRVLWPLTRAGRWAGGALVFIPVCGEYLVPHFIGHGRVTMLGQRIEQAFGQRNWPYVAALAVWLLLLVAVPVLLSVLARTETPSREGHARA